MHNEELHKLRSSAYIIRMMDSCIMGQAGHVTRMEVEGNAYRVSMGNSEGKRPAGVVGG
jgi:hypothetical protein